MIISHHKKFIFISPYKTASTSIEIALSALCGNQDILTPLGQRDELKRLELNGKKAQNHIKPYFDYSFSDIKNAIIKQQKKIYHKHTTAKKTKQSVSKKVWNNYYKFTLERNPFDRLASFYLFMELHKKGISFYDFISNSNNPAIDSTQTYLENGQQIVDKIYQFEKLDQMLNDLTSILNLEKSLQLPEYIAKQRNREKKHYREVIDKKSKKWIQKYHGYVIERFDYEW
ncbi:MAG: hypothetical protein ACJARP_000507 [Vicingaceae bacterium]|jgi:hypothetical protein